MARVFSVLPISLLALYLLLSCHYAAADGEDDGKDESPTPTSSGDKEDENGTATPTSRDDKEAAEDQEGKWSCFKPCSKILEPVCGSNGVTYDNMCSFRNAKRCRLHSMTKLSDGECKDDDICKPACPFLKLDVCGSDGTTYDNYCEFRKALCNDKKLTIRYEGKCVGGGKEEGQEEGKEGQ